MEALSTVIDLIQKGLGGIGLFYIILGGYHFFDGYRADNSSDQAKGGKQTIAGAGIMALATVAVPLLKNIF